VRAPSQWVVTFDAAADDDMPASIDAIVVEHLLERLRWLEPSALFSPDRYALQLCVEAATPHEALEIATQGHAGAVRGLVPACWAVMRIEVVTLAEYKQSFSSSPDDQATNRISQEARMLASGATSAGRVARRPQRCPVGEPGRVSCKPVPPGNVPRSGTFSP